MVEDVAVVSRLGVGSLQSQDEEGSRVGCGWCGQECRATLGLAEAGRTELSLSEMGTSVGRRSLEGDGVHSDSPVDKVRVH